MPGPADRAHQRRRNLSA